MTVIVTKAFGDFLVSDELTVLQALRQLELTNRHVVVVVDRVGGLVGTFSDGDFRRWLVEVVAPDLSVPVANIVNRSCRFVSEGTASGEIAKSFKLGANVIPVVDTRRRVVALAFERSRDLTIAGRRISEDDPAFVIAEIGINHNGEINTARALVRAAANAGADCAKFQMRDIESLYRSGTLVTSNEDLGAEYTLDLLAESSLTTDLILDLMDYSSALGLVPLCTPWDIRSAQVLAEYGVPAYKIASADLTNHPLLEAVAASGRPMLVSTGMATENEIRSGVEVLQRASSEYLLLHCQSSYPPAERDLNLRYMRRLAEIGDCLVGYSSHERGYGIAVSSVAMGATVLEKHITLDRNSRGVDHVVSLEPNDFAEMVRQIRLLEEAFGSDAPRDLTQGEKLNRLSLAKSIVAARDLDVGRIVDSSDVSIRAPGRGIQPNRLSELLGTTLVRSLKEGDFFFETDLLGVGLKPRSYFPDRPWGLPVRFHDWKQLAEKSNPDFLEFHLSYRDLEVDFRDCVPENLSYSLVLHSPDLFIGDHILDLAESDDSRWRQSVDALQRVIDLANTMQERFHGGRKTLVVASLGGSSKDHLFPTDQRPELYERVSSALNMLDFGDVSLLAQTLPPYPWYLGGQRFCNLFVDPEETATFAKEQGIGICLDFAHTKLACNSLGLSFARAVEVLAPLSQHFHMVDAAGLDSEGLQIGDGEIDWPFLVGQLRRLSPGVSFIPEIWQGHVDSGLGFWIAMERLEAIMLGDSDQVHLVEAREVPLQ